MSFLSGLLVVRQRRDFWTLVLAICSFAVLMALALGYVMTPAGERVAALRRALLISCIISLPIAYWMAKGLWVIHRLNSKLEFMLNHDPLTGVFTRRYFFETFRGDHAQSPAVIALVDVDHFKSINDTYGHHIGDAMLKEVTSALTLQCGTQDFVARLGGEEFVVCLVGMSMDEAMEHADVMRGAVEQCALLVGEEHVRCTISVGLGHRNAGAKLDAVLREADAALYVAKGSGRNQVRRQAA